MGGEFCLMVLILPWYVVDGSQAKLSGELEVGAHTGLALEPLLDN
jgi:hypothetical protein